MASKKKGRAREWIGGVGSVSAYVTGEDAPFQPEVLVFIDADGDAVGMTMAKPGEVLAKAGGCLGDAIAKPMHGRPGAPSRVRVASPELAAVLRTSHPALEVVCAPTPEIDAVLASVAAMLDRGADAKPSYLAPDIDEAAVASFFHASASLFRAKPWESVPDGDSPLSVTIEALDLRDAVVSVVGQMKESYGVVLFRTLDDFEAFCAASDDIEDEEDPAIPPHASLGFERGGDLLPSLLEEIDAHRWEVAAPNAHPWISCADEGTDARGPTAKELTIFEAIALALPKVLADREALAAAWRGGEPVTRTVVVETHAGPVEVTVRAPYAPIEVRPIADILGDLVDLENDVDDLDTEERLDLEDELVHHFAASPEANSLDEIGSCRLVMEYAANTFGATIATLSATQLREILFDVIPRKVSVDASEARAIIEESRAFFSFLKRACELEQADACLRVLGGDAIKRLEGALSDPRNFGVAKSLVMQGREAGFDMQSPEGLEAWMQVMNSRPLVSPMGLPPIGGGGRPHDAAAARAKKNQRKAARKARKKNR